MSFFDDIGKKITDAGRSAAEKAKDLAEITHLNSVIKENETQTDTLFAELGEAYFNAHKNDRSPEFAELTQKIASLVRQTEEYRNSLLELKGVAKCPYCGAEFPADETECPECGKAVPKAAVATTDSNGNDRLICAVCGYHMRPGSNFCIMCGTPVKKDGRGEEPKEPEKLEPIASPAVKPVAVDSPKDDLVTAPAKTADAATLTKTAPSVEIPEQKTAEPAPVEFSDFEEQPESIDGSDADTELDDIAAKAAAAISQITAEKIAARQAYAANSENNAEPVIPSKTADEEKQAAETPSELPVFDAIDDGLVVEEQTFSDAPSGDIPMRPRNTVSRPNINARRCKNCGALLPDGAVFCTKCGAHCESAEHTPPVCPGCGAFVSAGMVFCPECGMKLV